MSNRTELFAEDENQDTGSVFSNITGTTVGTKRGYDTRALQVDPNGNLALPRVSGIISAGSTNTVPTTIAPFDTGIMDLGEDLGYLYTEIASDTDGTLVGTWYDDSAGTNVIRNFSLPYTASNELSLTGTRRLSRYLRYVYTPATNPARFHFRTIVSANPATGQLLRVDGFVPPNVLAQLTRSVLVGLDPSNTYRNIGTNDAGALLVSDFLFSVATGNFSNYYIDTKFGNNPDIDTGTTPEDIWAAGGVYTGQPPHSDAAETAEIRSSSASDTAAGTGARTVRVSGLDENWAEQTVDVTLNGTSFVTLTGSWRRINRAFVLTAGSGGENAGALTIRHTSTTANIFAVLPIGNNQTTIAAYTVPANKTMYILRLRASIARSSGAAGSAQYVLLARQEGSVFRGIRNEAITTSYPLDYTLKGAIVLPEKTDVKVRCTDVSDSNTAFSAAFEYVLIDN